MTFTFPPSGPVPPYANPPIHPEYYKPKNFDISNVTLGVTTTVTTVLDMDYVIGQNIRLLIPQSFGCNQLNGAQGYILSLPASNQVEIDINSSTNVDPYLASNAPTRAQIKAIGDLNTGVINFGRTNNGTFIPGSFINISPL